MTPISSLLLLLLFEVSTGAYNISTIDFFLMETADNACAWVLCMVAVFVDVLAQNKKWIGKGVRLRTMRGIWWLVIVGLGRGWQLTLVGMAVALVFAGVMELQAALMAKGELRNERAREEVTKGYYDVSFSFFLFCLLMLMKFW
jgi:ABC-type iron transport system FetAB permease component